MVAWNDLRVYLFGLIFVTAALGAEAQPPASGTAVAPEPDIKIDQVNVTGHVDGEQFAVTLQFEVQVDRVPATLRLFQGQAVLDTLDSPAETAQLSYDPNDNAYLLTWDKKGRYQVDATFMVGSQVNPNNLWRQAAFRVPAGRLRQVKLTSRQTDIDLQVLAALNVERSVDDGQLVMEALLGPREMLRVMWKPQVQLTGAELVLSSETNTIVDVRAGLMHVDSLFGFQVAQGQIESLTFNVPTGLRVTSLEGPSIRSWAVGDPNDGIRPLRVELSRPQTNRYYLRIQAEMAMDALPATVDVPVIEPTGGIRASGQLAVGTNSALQLVVQESSGLTQIDAAAFPRVRASDSQIRDIPTGKGFFYSYAGSRYRLSLLTDDIVPAYEVADRFIARIKEDDLQIDAELELDVRDAPIRQLEIVVPTGWVVAAVEGEQVEDYHLPDTVTEGEPATVRVTFKEPVLGRTLLGLRLELGRGPLGETQTLTPLQVVGAKTQRGYVVIATETGIELDTPTVVNLREVHTASVPLRVPQAQYAYRFRDADWTLSVLARRRPAEVRAEVFHLQSLSQTLAYGSAVVNYLIAGSPVDELTFRLPTTFENVEFVGRDVRRFVQQGDLWAVQLTRKVLGDYNLAVTYTQRHSPGQPIQLGALQCADVQTQTGYVVVTSHLDLRLSTSPDQTDTQAGLLPISLDELPGDYRLLTSSPILSAYKYVATPHVGTLTIDPYQRSELLDVVVDIADVQTRLAVRPDGRIESATTVRYEIKNTTGQFLALTMPAGANIWSVSSIERNPNGSERAVRLAASHDDNTGQLLVPLRRQANPNAPLTVQLEYGQAHESGRKWRPHVNLEAPRSAVPVVYADWRVTVPDGYAVDPAGGNMQPQTPSQRRASLALLVKQVAGFWSESAQDWIVSPGLWALSMIAAIGIVVIAVMHRVWLPELVVILLLIGLIWIGFGAGMGRVDPPTASTTISYAQPVSIESTEALTVNVGLVPTWRRSIEVRDIVGVAAVIVAALALALIRRRWWKVALAAVVSAAIYLAARIPGTWQVLKAVGTWLPPTVLALWFVYRLWRRQSVPARVVLATLVLLVLCASSGCNTFGDRPQLVSTDATIEKIDCALEAGDDSMQLAYHVRLITDKPAVVPLLSESAVLTSPAEVADHVRLRTEKGKHVIAIDKAGAYDVNVTFLEPLTPAGADQQRRFELPLPPALTNAVSLVIPDANVAVQAPGALFLEHARQQERTRVNAKFAPGQSAVFTWRPLERQAAQEETRFYAQDQALAYVTPGLLQVFHTIRLQIAQGQVDRLNLDVGQGQTVTSVSGPQIGAWRYDPAARRLEIRLNQPAVGSYAVSIVTQSANASVPYGIRLEPLTVGDAQDQHSIVALAEEPSVFVRLEQRPPAMNIQDYVREVGNLVSAAPGVTIERIGQAFRFDAAGSVVTGRVQAVQSEVRSQETARFNVEDDRLVYNSQWSIEIAKAGRFDVDLVVPEGFDIDSLEAQEVSHWDETTEEGQRRIRVHFRHQLMGTVQLRLAMSQAVAEIPARLSPPRVQLAGAVKHTGYLLVGSEQGVRISVASRQGVSEINPAELGQSEQGLLAFLFLRPDWDIQLQTELIQPRITVHGLHIAKVTDGLVRHQHMLRYQLYHAGAKTFTLNLPAGALGVTITGAGIARREQTAPQQWQVELADKVYERPFLMTVSYETRYDPADGNVPLLPVQCQEADLQQGYTAVFATDRVELAAGTVDSTLRPADARSIPAYFGAGDLSGAAMCYLSQSAQYALVVRATRHLAAEQIGAEVLRTELFSVVTTAGQTIDRAALRLRVGTLRHLQTILPEGATIWSLAVDGQAVQPSLRTTSNQRQALLIPLPQQATDDVLVDLVYVTPLPPNQGNASTPWSGSHMLVGPRFDLPLKNITWQVYLPQDFHYDDFGGTMSIDSQMAGTGRVARYGRQTYLQRMVEVNRRNDSVAQQQQNRARELAQRGDQAAARQALTKGYNFSMGNTSLNEDIRVDLDNLVRQQAMVGLINARDRLRQQSGVSQSDGVAAPSGSFSTQQAERLASSLGQADNENLDLITRRIIQTQAAAEAPVSQLQVAVPTCGQVYQFSSPLQVEPAAEMAVTFSAKPKRLAGIGGDTWWGLGLFVGLVLCGLALKGAGRLSPRLHAALTPTPRPARPVEPQAPAQTPDDTTGPDDKLSSDELL